MEHLFFSLPGQLNSIAEKVYSAIGVANYLEGDSYHATRMLDTR
jgi:hypothetical protein